MPATENARALTLVLLRDSGGFTGAEKALLSCVALAVVLLGGKLALSGSTAAATDAKRVLSGDRGGASALQQLGLQPMRAGEVRAPGTMGRAGALSRHGAGQVPAALLGAATNLSAPSDAKLTYRGGNVVANPKIYAVFWENGDNKVNGTVKDQIGGFYQAVTNSPYMDWLSEYNTPTQSIGRGSYGGAITITPQNSGNSLTNQDIQAEINRQIDAGVLPPPDANTIYMISFPPQVSIDLDGSKSCEAFCAYHNTMQRNGQSVYYGVLPDVSADSQCSQGCGGSSNSFDNQTSVASHELIETVTDPDVGLADNDPSKLGWYDDKYGEIGDICNAQQGNLPGTNYVVQKEYSNSAGDCIVSKGS